MNRKIIALSIATVLASASSLAAAFPSSGEFSAADVSPTYTASNVTRAEVRQAAESNRGVVNGEIPAEVTASQDVRTRSQVREEGRLAARAGHIAHGDMSL